MNNFWDQKSVLLRCMAIIRYNSVYSLQDMNIPEAEPRKTIQISRILPAVGPPPSCPPNRNNESNTETMLHPNLADGIPIISPVRSTQELVSLARSIL